MGVGKRSTLHFGFTSSQNNSYKLDKDNNLIASQNFDMVASLSGEVLKIDNIAKAVGNLLSIAEAVDFIQDPWDLNSRWVRSSWRAWFPGILTWKAGSQWDTDTPI
ncbi:MAG: hypothetical protein NTW16_02660 [Bacteroidetes bacterium]|nr:hypothetical protein [Bacteroidota bacterium]